MAKTAIPLLLTRPAAQSARFAQEALPVLGPRPVVISPVLEIVPRPAVLPDRIGGLIFTSESGVATLPAGVPRDVPAFCVGPRTAAAAERAGFSAIAAGGDAQSLLALLCSRPVEEPLLHVRGAYVAADLEQALAAAGIAALSVVTYDQQARPLSAEARALLGGASAVLVPLFSPRSARLVGVDGPVAAPVLLAALSSNVANAWTGPRPRAVRIAATPESSAMIAALAALLAADAALA